MCAARHRRLDDGVHGLIDARPLRLVQPVFRCELEKVEPAGGEGIGQQCGSADIEYGIGTGHFISENASRLRGLTNKVRYEDHGVEIVRQWDCGSDPTATVLDTDLASAKDRGSDVIGMALDLGRQFERFLRVGAIALERKPGHDTAYDCGGAAAEAAGERDSVNAVKLQVRELRAPGFVCGTRPGDNEVGLITWKHVSAIALDHDFKGAVLDRELAPQIDSDTDRIETRSEVRRGGGDAHGDTPGMVVLGRHVDQWRCVRLPEVDIVEVPSISGTGDRGYSRNAQNRVTKRKPTPTRGQRLSIIRLGSHPYAGVHPLVVVLATACVGREQDRNVPE